jgi:hypothetical protein
VNKESWTGRFLDPAKVATAELKICGRCWDARNRTVDQHGCEAMDETWRRSAENYMVSDSGYLRLCDCPCSEEPIND